MNSFSQRKIGQFCFLALAGILLVFGTGFLQGLPWLSSEVGARPVMAQAVRTQDLWREVYKQLPSFPLENQYVSRQTGQVDPDNTLAKRLITYHLFVKGRPANLRLDWKLTLADYLDANELMKDLIYPGADLLTQNPIDQDRRVIASLNRSQREELVIVLVRILSSAPRR